MPTDKPHPTIHVTNVGPHAPPDPGLVDALQVKVREFLSAPSSTALVLADIPTAALLAELDRRAQLDAPPKVWFYGVWPGQRAGHFMRDKHGNMTADTRGYYPWNTREDRAAQDEGLLWHRHVDGRTLLLSWDRSADARGNCVASFIVGALVTPERALELARADYPEVFARIEQHLGRATRLAGPAENVA